MKTVLITGSSGLIGSEAVIYFDQQGDDVYGIDNNMRADFFGPKGDTTWNLNRLLASTKHFQHQSLDIRDRQSVIRLISDIRPDLIIHAAAQPSHDLAAKRPLDDFDVNAVGTMNLLESARLARDASKCDPVFVFMSTNKVYGDVPNELAMIELPTRYEYSDLINKSGIKEDLRIDFCTHSIFGASKVAADVMTQEYGRYFGLKSCVFRGGCLTGPSHSGVELHGFLNYLFKAAKEGFVYTIYGYKGKQVRDNIHAKDVIKAIDAFFKNPRPGEVYNIGGGRANSCSIIEAMASAEKFTGQKMKINKIDQNRKGDHICYITDMTKFISHYPSWSITYNLNNIYHELTEVNS